MDINDILSKTKEGLDLLSKLEMPPYDCTQAIFDYKPEMLKVEVDEKSTFAYQIQQQTNKILEKSNEQIQLLCQQNEQLANNYKTLEGLYALKEKELEEAKKEAKEAKEEAKKAKTYNNWMMLVSVVSALVAIASWVFPIV